MFPTLSISSELYKKAPEDQEKRDYLFFSAIACIRLAVSAHLFNELTTGTPVTNREIFKGNFCQKSLFMNAIV